MRVREVEEAVPGNQTVEGLFQLQGAHVGDRPVLGREPVTAQADQRRRRVDPGEAKALLDQIPTDRLRRSAADIEDGSAARQERGNAIEPRFFEQCAPAIGVPIAGMPLVKIDDPLGQPVRGLAVIRHRAAIPQLCHIECVRFSQAATNCGRPTQLAL